MGNVESTDTNGPIQHSDEHLVVEMPFTIQEIRSVQFGLVSRGGRDILSFHLALLLILYSPNILLNIILASNGVSSFVRFLIVPKVVFWRYFALNAVLILDEVHNNIWCVRSYHKIVHVHIDVITVVTRLVQLDPNVSVKYSGRKSDG